MGVRRVVRLLEHGDQAKRIVDAAIDANAAMLNLRVCIMRCEAGAQWHIGSRHWRAAESFQALWASINAVAISCASLVACVRNSLILRAALSHHYMLLRQHTAGPSSYLEHDLMVLSTPWLCCPQVPQAQAQLPAPQERGRFPPLRLHTRQRLLGALLPTDRLWRIPRGGDCRHARGPGGLAGRHTALLC